MVRNVQRVERLRAALIQVERALSLLDEGQPEDAGSLAEQTVEQLTERCGADWQELRPAALVSTLGNPERARALARALWIASTVDEMQGRMEQARRRCRRAMELFGRVRLPSEEIDIRAARELGSASGRLGATRQP